ncbi:site-specific DNA-methyltransferase [Pseudomonas lundensis]|nr:site-specific DNA-methyltransferase [Pseudomonas lundensis]NNA39250.1 site-specific DNA-methyltransferase [Pseudomonas lundensis]
MRSMPDSSVESIVTDPPYGMSFMGKKWDYAVPGVEVWAECLRVLKPGGHLLAFAGARTQHRMAVRIEDAGFEIRDMIAWVYGSGFPKSHNLSGAHEGWGTALKPALEPITVARKPFPGTVAANVLAHGVGALNIDGCRVEVTDALGRWPANLIHDGSPEVVALFPAQAGAAAPVHTRNADKFRNSFGAFAGNSDEAGSTFHGDSGSAARFFYCPKASRKDRNEGLTDPGPQFKRGTTLRQVENAVTTGNNHPTVKPTDLMRYLCRLVTPMGGLVLDPFMGSGSTGKAASLEGFRFVGIELDPDYFAIAKARVRPIERQQDAQRDLFPDESRGVAFG